MIPEEVIFVPKRSRRLDLGMSAKAHLSRNGCDALQYKYRGTQSIVFRYGTLIATGTVIESYRNRANTEFLEDSDIDERGAFHGPAQQAHPGVEFETIEMYSEYVVQASPGLAGVMHQHF